MTKRYVLDRYSSDDNYNGDIQGAYVEITPELAKLILQRRDTFLALKQKDHRLSEMRFWSYDCRYLGHEDLSAGQTQELENFLESGHDGPGDVAAPPGEWDQRMECQEMEIDDTWVRWSALIKHADCRISTSHIAFAELEELAKEAA